MAAAVAPGLPPRRSLRGVLIASAGCFLALALAVGFTSSLPGDTAVREALLALASPPVLAAMRVINRAGSWQLLLPGSLLLLLAFRRARERWYVWVGLMIAAPATEGILKIIIGRPRPEAASMGFPSGHATAAAAFFGAVFYLAESLRSEEHTSELQSQSNLVCRLLLEKKKKELHSRQEEHKSEVQTHYNRRRCLRL